MHGAGSLTSQSAGSGHVFPGLVWAYQFDEEGRGRPAALNSEFDLSGERNGFVWLHFDLIDRRACDWCERQPAFPAAAKSMFSSADGHLRLGHHGEQLWGVFADLAHEFGRNSHSTAQLRFVMGDRWLVTGRRHHLRGVLLAREKIDQALEIASPCRLLETIVSSFAEEIGRIVDALDHEVAAVEERVIGRVTGDEGLGLGPIRRRCLRLNGQLSRFHAVLRDFMDDPAEPPAEMLAAAKRLGQRMHVLHHDIHAVQERARLVQEEASERRATEMNSNLYLLSILTALLMPPTLIVGIFGMNTGGLPLTDSPYGSLAATILAVIVAAAVFWLYRRFRASAHRGLR
jgi:zinc transporter